MRRRTYRAKLSAVAKEKRDQRSEERAKALGLVLVGGILIVGGTVTLDEVQCDRNGRNATFIEPGESCETTTFWLNEEVTRTYTEQEQIDDLESYALLAIGITMAAAGSNWWVRAGRNRTAATPRPSGDGG